MKYAIRLCLVLFCTLALAQTPRVKTIQSWQARILSSQMATVSEGDWIEVHITCTTGGWDICGWADYQVDNKDTPLTPLYLYTDAAGVTHQGYGVRSGVSGKIKILVPVECAGIPYDITLTVIGV